MSAKRVVLPGLQAQPLSSYLAALGLLRICGSQLDPAIRGAFAPGGFALENTDGAGLLAFLLDTWRPTPVFSPWNNASGFYASTKGRLAAVAMEELAAAGLARLQGVVDGAAAIRRIVAREGYSEAPSDEEKARFVGKLRSELSDDAVSWLDAVAVIDEDDARMMPLLGSGGNEGVLEYSGLFLRCLVEALLGDRSRSVGFLRAAIFGDHVAGLLEQPAGQFSPGSAGGFNTGPGFEAKQLPNNPWTFILLIEGALVWSGALATRQNGADAGFRFAVSPFTVRHRAAGYGSAVDKDNDPQRVRAEVWTPVWSRPSSFPEVLRVIAEGRAEVFSKAKAAMTAGDSLDFLDAIASLGTDRGISSFCRYTMIKRRGDSYIALPASVVAVNQRREVDLLRELDGELTILDQFIARFPGEGPPAALSARRRAIDEARFEVALRGGSDAMRRLVRAIGALEMALARRDPGKDPKLWRPLGGLSAAWVDACGDSSEVRLAAALASIGPSGSVGPMRAYLSPLAEGDPRRYAPALRPTSWVGPSLAHRLASVLQRRLLDARRSSQTPGADVHPTRGARKAHLDDVAGFLESQVDEHALEELLFGFGWVDFAGAHPVARASSGPPVSRTYALLKLLCLPHKLDLGATQVALPSPPALVPLLTAGRISDAVDLATDGLRARGLHARRLGANRGPDPEHGRRLAAALLIPVMGVKALMATALRPDVDHDTDLEMTDGH